ncbi:MAG: hypothetical protein QOH70_81 [Blastocatellia bacterium]|jgi:hypothetical protein|nr:hypothetical protein [Blastocatellia bacterium]
MIASFVFFGMAPVFPKSIPEWDFPELWPAYRYLYPKSSVNRSE